MRAGLASTTYVEWEPVLRCLLDGRPVYEPGAIDFRDVDGEPLDLGRSFTLDDPPDEIGHFLAEAGFLHLEGVFTEDEMAAVSAELDDAVGGGRAATTARRGGPAPRTASGTRRGSSASTRGRRRCAELLRSDRFATVGTFTDDRYVQRDPDAATRPRACSRRSG